MKRICHWTYLPHLITLIVFAVLLRLLLYNHGTLLNSIPLLIAIWAVYHYTFAQVRCGRELLFQTHLRPESSLNLFRHKYVFLRIVVLSLATIGVLSLLIFLLTLKPWILALIAASQLFFHPIRKWWHAKWVHHLKPLSLTLWVNFLTISTLGIFSTLLFILGKAYEIQFPLVVLAEASSFEITEYVREKVNYDPVYLQHIGRILLKLELELLRATYAMESTLAWLVRLFFLLPSAAAGFTLATLHAGLFFLFQDDLSPKRAKPAADQGHSA